MPLFLIRHQHEAERCPAADPCTWPAPRSSWSMSRAGRRRLSTHSARSNPAGEGL
jgi:hypothetical protein